MKSFVWVWWHDVYTNYFFIKRHLLVNSHGINYVFEYGGCFYHSQVRFFAYRYATLKYTLQCFGAEADTFLSQWKTHKRYTNKAYSCEAVNTAFDTQKTIQTRIFCRNYRNAQSVARKARKKQTYICISFCSMIHPNVLLLL